LQKQCVLEPLILFQSTPPRGGRLAKAVCIRTTDFISIHAPAWGATVHWIRKDSTNINFNPRPRVGSDFNCSSYCAYAKISIHAPAWGATANMYKLTFVRLCYLLQHCLENTHYCNYYSKTTANIGSFVSKYRCEPLRDLMFALGSHRHGFESNAIKNFH
jgi:hypothetical protein